LLSLFRQLVAQLLFFCFGSQCRFLRRADRLNKRKFVPHTKFMKENINVLFKPFPKQIEFLNAIFSGNFDFVLYGGSIRGGKTFSGIGALLILCRAFPGSRWAIVRTDLPTLKRNTIPSFWKICPVNFLRGGSIKTGYNQDTQTVTFKNGSQILFFAENFDQDKELNRWKGLEVNGFLLEEINELQQKSFNKAIERAGSNIIAGATKQPRPIIIATCNPAQNWVKKQIYDPWKNGSLPNRWTYIPAKIFDNPFISDDYLNALKNMPAFEYEVFVNGNWDIELKSGGEFYKSFDMSAHTGSVAYDPTKALHISFDENVNPYITAVVWQIHKDEIRTDLNMIAEYCLPSPNNTVRKLCDAIARDFNGHSSGLFIYGDATSRKADTKLEKGHNFFTLIRDYLIQFAPNLRVPLSNPSVVMRGNFINTIFEKNYSGVAIKISSDCVNTISDFNNVKEDADGTKKKEKERNATTGITFEKYGHTSDACDYFICEVLKPEFNQYSSGRPTFDHVRIGYNKNNSANYY
jgi:hypothetical protein